MTDNSSIFRLPHGMTLRELIFMMPALAFFSLTACSFDAKFRRQSLEAPTKEVKLEYRSLPGDKILLTFMHNLDDSVTDEYRLQQGDGIQISVQDRDDINRVSSIAPDGNIYFPYLEPIPAAGKTLKQLGQLTEEKYQPLVKSARVSLAPVNFSGKTESLLHALSSPGKPGSNYETVIGMDGSAVFPQLGFLKIVGFTPEDLNTFLQGKYRKIMPGIAVTANLTGGTSRLVTLLGELRRPGSFDISGPISLTAALGLAEGWLPSAHVQDIILVQKRAGQVSISKYDLGKDLMVATQIQLTGGDLVFVPRSAITDLNIFIDQYIRRNMPFAVGINAPLPIFQNTQSTQNP